MTNFNKQFKLFFVTMLYGDFSINLHLTGRPHHSRFFPCKLNNPILNKTLAVWEGARGVIK